MPNDFLLTFVFAVICFRTIEGLGSAMYLNSGHALMLMEFEDPIIAFSKLETAYGIGMIVGPAFGGLLYFFYGYSWPFLVMGTLRAANAILSATQKARYCKI